MKKCLHYGALMLAAGAAVAYAFMGVATWWYAYFNGWMVTFSTVNEQWYEGALMHLDVPVTLYTVGYFWLQTVRKAKGK